MSRFNSVSLLALSGMMVAGLTALPADAQEVLRGRIVDGAGSPLPGARVNAVEAGTDTSTNRQGEFSFSSVPAGDLTLEVDYLGFPNARRIVTVTAGTVNNIVVTLGEDDQALERVVVRGAILDGTARALNQQRTNDATTNIVSADAIGRFPDQNIAEALQRVPGFGIARDQGEGRFINLRGAPSEFTAISVNGAAIASPDATTRAVDLDTIPSDVVNAIEVSKTLLPFQDADSIAGSVNLVTRSPFDKRGFRVNFSGGGSFNEIGDTNDYRASAVVSNTFGSNEQFGALFSVSHSFTDRQVDNLESNWDVREVNGQDVFFVDEIVFKDYDTRRTRTALTAALEYRPDDRSQYFLRGNWSRFEDDEYRNLLLLDLAAGGSNALQPGFTNSAGTWTNTRIEKELRHRTVRNTIWNLQAGGRHDLGATRFDYQLSYNESEQTYPQRDQLLLRSSQRPTISYDYANPDEPSISLFQTNEHLNASAFAFRRLDQRFEENITTEWAARANVELDGALFGNSAEHKFGAAIRMRETERDDERWRSPTTAAFAPSSTVAQLLTGGPSKNFGYNLGTKINEGLADHYFDSMDGVVKNNPVYIRPAQSVASDYSVEENIYAVYGMTRVSLDKTDVIAGLRVEHTEFSSTAFRLNTTTNTATPVANSRDYTNWFPNLTARHEFNDNLIGRLALTRAIARPNYPDVVARISVGDTPPLTVNRGNPNLRPTISNNVDAGVEYYFAGVGLLAANAFYKDLENYEFTLRTGDQVFEGQPATFIQAENAPDGFIRGIEFTWQQSFSFLPGFLGNFGVFANATFTDSEMNVGRDVGGRSKFPLQGQSDQVYNASVFYETERFNARLSWNNRSDYLDGIDAEDSRFDLYWEGRSQLDFTTSFKANDQIEYFLEAKNLTDTEGVRYFGSRQRVYERERFGYTVFGGVRVNF
ncbi:TonB-dependent receptor [Hyphomonas sp.]|uniref:TonB-dependent receptor n=1 Tax=Hyphomonas sp. TaxID=87 RepID=UPI00391A24CE